MSKTILKYEKWNNRKSGKKYIEIVVREVGKIVQRRKLKGSGIKSKQEAVNIFKTNLTFYKDRKRQKLTNVSETTITNGTSLTKLKKSKPVKRTNYNIKNPQYQISGYYEKKLVVARSLKLGLPMCKTPRACKEYAKNKFLLILGETVLGSGHYDADEGISILENRNYEVSNLQEGWVYYN